MEYTTIQKTADRWGVSHQYVHQLCQEGRIPGAVYENKHWRIPLYVAKPADRTSTRMPGYISATQAAEKWGTSREFVYGAAREGRISGAKQVGRNWYIPEYAEKPTDGRIKRGAYIFARQAAEKWGTTRKFVHRAAQEGRIPGAKQVGQTWYIPEYAEKPADERRGRESNYISITQAAEKWGTSREFVCGAAREGRISGAKQVDQDWQIPEDAPPPTDGRSAHVPGYISPSKMAEKWGVSVQLVLRLCKESRISGTILIDNKWQIPADAVKPANKLTERKLGYMSATETAEKWGLSSQFVSRLCKEGHIPGAEMIDGYWHIPEDATKPRQKRTNPIPGYLSAAKAAAKWGVTQYYVFVAAKEGHIPGAEFIDGKWYIPEDAEKPIISVEKPKNRRSFRHGSGKK